MPKDTDTLETSMIDVLEAAIILIKAKPKNADYAASTNSSDYNPNTKEHKK